MATKYDQSSATRPVSIRSHTSAFQVHFKHTSSALEMSSVNSLSFSAFFARQRNNIVLFSVSVKHQVESPSLIIFFFNILTLHLFNVLNLILCL